MASFIQLVHSKPHRNGETKSINKTQVGPEVGYGCPIKQTYHSLPSNICQIQASLLATPLATPPPIDSRTVRQKTRWRKGWRSQSHPFWAVFAPFCTVFAPFRTIFAPFCAVSDRSESFSDRFERRTLRKVCENLRKLRENSRIACYY